MAKKLKKKPRSGQKDKRSSALLQKTVSEHNVPAKTETVDNSLVGRENKACPHFDRGIDFVKVSSKISSAEHIRCEDCRVGVVETRANKVKTKQGKKKKGLSSVGSRPESKAIWVCLECGTFSCGGIGFPTILHSHAVRHARQTRHPLAIQFENVQLCWCFPCSTLVPIEKTESGEPKDPLLDIVKTIKGRLLERVSVDAEDICFGSGCALSETKSENTAPFCLGGTSGYVVKGLVNLGNTCFFNSIMQNLLAMDRLRDHFMGLNESIGPLALSFRKIFVETMANYGLINVINPRSFFHCVCAKAPQFRGCQQHDSHELLRCLLDGLCAEESSARKRTYQENGASSNDEPIFVDAVFGGQLSSTVSCLECGHSSKVFEPFLDLSLPVPTSKKSHQSTSRAKKQKPPPKRKGRVPPKAHKDQGALASSGVSISSLDGAQSRLLEYVPSVAKQAVDAVNDAMDSSNQTSVKDIEKKPLLENDSNDLSWLDYLEPPTMSNNVAAFHGAGERGNGQIYNSLQDGVESHSQGFNRTTSTGSLENLGWLDDLEPSKVPDDLDVVSKPCGDDSVNQDTEGRDVVLDNTHLNNLSVPSTYSLCAESNCSEGNFDGNELPSQVQGSEILLLPYKEEVCPNGETLQGKGQVPLQVQGSEVLLLPYKENICSNGILEGEGEVSSSAIGYEPDALGFDGLGGLFNEPDIAEGPSVKPASSVNNFQVEISSVVDTSESDPDGVDNTDPQVSVESCLAYFTKLELLSNEHGWNCENCSKVLQERRKQSREKHQKVAEKVLENGVEDRVHGSLSSGGRATIWPSEVQSPKNGDINKNVTFSEVVDEDTNIEKVDQTIEASCFQGSNERHKQFPSEANVSGISGDECSMNSSTKAVCRADDARGNEVQILAKESDSEGNGNEENISETIKVKRDATKRILVSKAPPILTIHLKRFGQDARGRLSKLNGQVDFKDTIDLRPHMDPRCKERDNCKYRLTGVVEHLGSMKGGHYVAYVRGSGKAGNADNNVWYHASDADVRRVSLQEVLQCEAYILFYDKI